MSANRYFEKLYIPPTSPLIEYLGISSGEYSGRYDFQEKKLYLKKKNTNKIESATVTPEQLLVILTHMVKRDRGDKYTPEELNIINQIRRSNSFSGTKISPNHHIIPLEVCKRSKLVINAKRMGIFSENDDINKRPLPIYFHRGSHPEYSNLAEDLLEDGWDELVKAEMEKEPCEVKKVLQQIIDFLKNQINQLLAQGICTIHDI